MARKKTAGRAKSFSEAIGLQYIFNNTITDFFLGLALVVMAVVLLIAMVSFINTGAADQSLLENLRPGEWTNTEKQFQNYCGSMGAIISYWLMALNFGFPAFLLPCFVAMAGFQLMHVYTINLWKWFLSMMIIMLRNHFHRLMVYTCISWNPAIATKHGSRKAGKPKFSAMSQ